MTIEKDPILEALNEEIKRIREMLIWKAKRMNDFAGLDELIEMAEDARDKSTLLVKRMMKSRKTYEGRP